MAGIYLHIPYCKFRCIYCDFYKETDESSIDAFGEAVCREMELRKEEIQETVHTVYFGGGTPSRLNKYHFDQIFSSLFNNFQIDRNAEITLEANPDDLTSDYIGMLQTLPINRISIGIQSFDDAELQFLSRRHSARQAVDAVHRCQRAGYDNISIDLMYGLPKQTIEMWESNLQLAMDLNIQHISAYHLIFEEHTKLYTMLQRGKVRPAPDELSVAMFDLLIKTTAQHGFEFYEVSNFAKNQLYSRHNTSYWQNKPYLGLGPSAHSYNGSQRLWNVSSIEKYIQSIHKEELCLTSENLTFQDKYNEFVLTAIRTKWGVDLKQLRKKFGLQQHNYCLKHVQKHIDSEAAYIEGDFLKLTLKGVFMADGVASDLMWVE